MALGRGIAVLEAILGTTNSRYGEGTTEGARPISDALFGAYNALYGTYKDEPQHTHPREAMMPTVQDLLNRCKCGVFIEVNVHRDYYESVETYLGRCGMNGGPADVDPAVKELMVKCDTIIAIQAYPETPIGFVNIYHYSLQMAVAETLRAIEENWK